MKKAEFRLIASVKENDGIVDSHEVTLAIILTPLAQKMGKEFIGRLIAGTWRQFWKMLADGELKEFFEKNEINYELPNHLKHSQ